MTARRWDRSGCLASPCTCHDDSARPYRCSGCGCRPSPRPACVIGVEAWRAAQSAWLVAVAESRSYEPAGSYDGESIAWWLMERDWERTVHPRVERRRT